MYKTRPFESILALAEDIKAATDILEKTDGVKQAYEEQVAKHAALQKDNEGLKKSLENVRADIASALRKCDAECAAQKDEAAKWCAAQKGAAIEAAEAVKKDADAKVKAAAGDLARVESQYRDVQNACGALERERKRLEGVVLELRQKLSAV